MQGKSEIISKCKKLKAKKQQSSREETIVKLYDWNFRNDNDLSSKYRCYQLIKYLLNITDQQAIEEFYLNTDNGIYLLERCAKYLEIGSLSDI